MKSRKKDRSQKSDVREQRGKGRGQMTEVRGHGAEG